MPSNMLSPLVNIDALNTAYQLIRKQLDEKVYNTTTNPNETLGTSALPYPQAYITTLNARSLVCTNLDSSSNPYWQVDAEGNAKFASLNAEATSVGGSLRIEGNLDVVASSTAEGNITAQGNITTEKGITATGDIHAARVFNAVWNDIADAITVENQAITFEPGYAYAYDGRKWFKTKDKKSSYFGIHTDTAGYILGYNPEINQILIAIGGFVLAHVDNIYPSGTYLTYGDNGILTKAKRSDEKIAKFFKEEKSEEYNNIKVNGRSWIKIL